MRSPTEVQFRLKQEAANLYLLLRQPQFHDVLPFRRLNLPDPQQTVDTLRGSEYAMAVESLAEAVLRHRFPILGLEIATGPEIHWSRDYVHRKQAGLEYFKRVPYLNFDAVGDHKIIWEINRHQHLVLLAQASLLTDRPEFIDEIAAELTSWTAQNPFQRGVNWASALEVAFRSLSWIWIYHLVGDRLTDQARTTLVGGLYQHGLHLEQNLSVYFSPNTHLLGEAVALFTIGAMFPEFPEAQRWIEGTRQIVLDQASFQVQADGAHFEQSTYYHVYALDFFLFFYLVAGRLKALEPVIERMGEYLQWLLGPAREISFFGDDDGGRLFHPYGQRSRFGRATLATCGVVLGRPMWHGTADDLAEQAVWWLGSDCLCLAREQGTLTGVRYFEDSGAVFVQVGDFSLQMDCGPFGFGGAGHSHSDTLSLTVRHGMELVLIDPGTYTYNSSMEDRNWFRGSAAHNTVRIDEKDQAESINPFRWASKPQARLTTLVETAQGWLVDASCAYRGYRHRRRVLLNRSRLLVLDEVDGPGGEHTCEQIWQLGSAIDRLHLRTSAESSRRPSRYSPAYGQALVGRAEIAVRRGTFPMKMAMSLGLEDCGVLDLEEIAAIFESANELR